MIKDANLDGVGVVGVGISLTPHAPTLEIAECNAALNQMPRVDDNSENEISEFSSCSLDDIPDDFIGACLFGGEEGMSRLYIAVNKGKFCFDTHTGVWHQYRPPIWAPDLENSSLAEGFDGVIVCCNKCLEGLIEKYQLDKEDNRVKQIQKTVFFLKKFSYRKTIRDMAANGKHGLSVSGDIWDCDPYKMACGDLVIDLNITSPRMQLQPDPSYYLRRSTNIRDIDWVGEPVLFIKTLHEIFAFSESPPIKIDLILLGTEDGCTLNEAQLVYQKAVERYENLNQGLADQMIDYLQVLLGYALIGKVTENIIVILVGRGRNGKTMLVELFQHILGDYTLTVEPELLLATNSRNSSAPAPDILALAGKLLVFASESKETASFDAANVKRFTGGDTLTGRALYARSATSFTPSHTLFLLTNYPPNAPADDFAFWERVRLIQFMNSFVDEPNPENPSEKLKDKYLLDKLKAESPQILNWLIQGARRYQEWGLKTPDFVLESGKAYRSEVDLIGQFLDLCCRKDSIDEVRASNLYTCYSLWCVDNGFRPLSNKRFGSTLQKRGWKKVRRSDGYYYQGINVITEAIPASRSY